MGKESDGGVFVDTWLRGLQPLTLKVEGSYIVDAA